MEDIKKLIKKRDYIGAKELLTAFLKNNPDDTAAIELLGKTLVELKEYAQACIYFQKVFDIKKTPQSEGELGLCFYFLKQYDSAKIHLITCVIEKYEDRYAKILEKILVKTKDKQGLLGLKILMNQNHPKDIFILRDITKIAQELKKFDTAIEYFKILLKKCPDDYVAWNNLGLIYEEIADWQKAYDCYKKALSLKDFFSPNFNLGIITKKMHRFDDSIKYLKKAILQNPTSPQPKYSLSMSYLMLKDFAHGYPLYSRHMSVIMPFYYKNEWDGTPHPDKTLCVFATGGLGDMIMFARYFEYLRGKFKKVYVLIPENLISLFKRSYNDFEFIDSKNIFVNYDYAISPMHILNIFNLDFNVFVPHTGGYLIPDENLINKFKNDELFNHNKLKIAINWHGNREGTRTFFNRTMPIEFFEPFFEKFKNRAVFYSIQKDESNTDCNKYPYIINLYDKINNFDDTTAVLKNMDLLISIDSSPVHASGAAGVKTFVLLPFANEWRWFINDEKSIFYDSVLLFRQNSEGDWQSAVNKALIKAQELF